MTDAAPKKVVGVPAMSHEEHYDVLFRELSRLYPVEFRRLNFSSFEGLDGILLLNGDEKTGLAAASQGIASYVVGGGSCSRTNHANDIVEFGTSPVLDLYLQGQSMVAREETTSPRLRVQTGDEILAKRDGCPIWISRKTARSSYQIVAASPPVLREGECLFRYFNARCFLGLLPLLNFLRQLVANIDWQAPAPRACFVFDDPSLYLPSYGFLNYRLLAEHARKHDYFVSIATVPLDAWWANSDVVQTFRENGPRLSLVVHGNNHLPEELVKPSARLSHLAAAAQALRRMERLKRVHGLPFLKIMEAPHGASAEGMFEALLSVGYEAALCTTELLVLHNPNTAWPATVGFERSEILGGGLPVLPRIKMSPDWKNDVLLKAFLRQPIIIAGHHADAAGGMELLAELAKMIGQLKGVAWSDLQGVLTANYLERVEGDTLEVKMYSRRVRVPIPRGVKNLCVERPWLEPNRSEKLLVTTNAITRICHQAERTVDRLPLPAADMVEITSEFEDLIPASAVAPPRFSPWPIPRKFLMEIRDRLSPSLQISHRCRV